MVYGTFIPRGRRCMAWLSAVLIGFAGALGGCSKSSCEPEGELFAEANQLGTIALDEEVVYWTALTSTPGHRVGEVWRKAKAGGEPERIYQGTNDPVFPLPVLSVDATHVYWLEPCPAKAGDSCAEVHRAPKAGGPNQTLARDDIYSFAVDGDRLLFTTSQERHGPHGRLDPPYAGALWSMPKDGGGTPVALVSGLTKLRDVLVDETHVYFVADRGPEEGSQGREAWISRIPKEGGAVETVAWLDGGPGSLVMTDQRLVFLQGRALFMVNKGDPMGVYLKASEEAVDSLAVSGETVYFGDLGHTEGTTLDPDATNYICGAVRSMSIEEKVVKVFSQEQISPRSLITDGAMLYWKSGSPNSAISTLRRSRL